MRTIGSSDLSVFPLCLGGNVFGWTADEASRSPSSTPTRRPAATSSTPPTRYSRLGRRATAAASPRRSSATGWRRAATATTIVVATKVGKSPGPRGPRAGDDPRAPPRPRCARLRTDRIDLYYAHIDDDDTPLEETLGAFDELVARGQGAPHRRLQLHRAAARRGAATSARGGDLPRYVALQPHYNLVRPRRVRGRAAPTLCAREGVACVPYFALASGFLTGKYRAGGRRRRLAARRHGARPTSTSAASRSLAALDELAAAHGDDRRRGRARVAGRPADGGGADRQRAHARAARRPAADGRRSS